MGKQELNRERLHLAWRAREDYSSKSPSAAPREESGQFTPLICSHPAIVPLSSMTTLDCHNVDRTFKSLATIFGLRSEKIGAFLDKCDPEPDNIAVEKWPNHTLKRLGECESIDTGYDATYWFHFTRGPKGADFSDGLHPLGKALPELLNQLASIVGNWVEDEEWKSFEREVLEDNIEVANLSLRRRGYEQQQGPFGWLIRDLAFARSSKRDYLRRAPEAVEDLIGAVGRKFDISVEWLLGQYIRETRSYIVKFETSDTSNSNLASALYFLLRKRKDMGLTFHCTTSCSMHSETISPVNVEEFDDPPLIF